MEPDPPSATPRRRRRRVGWGAPLALLGVATALLCHELLLTVFVVQGVSMEPTLRSGQRVLVLRAPARVQRGDLVVFKNPVHPDEMLLKRVLAGPGEVIRAERGHVYVGDRELAEIYVKPGTMVGSFPPVRLREGQYYVAGDNRGESIDSRKFGEIDRRLILGKVVYRLW